MSNQETKKQGLSSRLLNAIKEYKTIKFTLDEEEPISKTKEITSLSKNGGSVVVAGKVIGTMLPAILLVKSSNSVGKEEILVSALWDGEPKNLEIIPEDEIECMTCLNCRHNNFLVTGKGKEVFRCDYDIEIFVTEAESCPSFSKIRKEDVVGKIYEAIRQLRDGNCPLSEFALEQALKMLDKLPVK